MNNSSWPDLALEVRSLSVVYPGTDGGEAIMAVHDLNLQVCPGEVLAIIGESGCGKSSLLGAMAHVTPVGAGRMFLFDVDYTRATFEQMRLLRRRLQLVPQDAAGGFDPRLAIGDVIRAALHWLRDDWSQAEKSASLDWALDVTGLDRHLLGRVPAACSGGQLKRAALCRALVSRPEVLLLDEPLSGLDWTSQKLLVEKLQSAQMAHSITVVMVSHEPYPLEDFAHRLLVLDEGREVESVVLGADLDEMKHPASRAWIEASRRRGTCTIPLSAEKRPSGRMHGHASGREAV